MNSCAGFLLCVLATSFSVWCRDHQTLWVFLFCFVLFCVPVTRFSECFRDHWDFLCVLFRYKAWSWLRRLHVAFEIWYLFSLFFLFLCDWAVMYWEWHECLIYLFRKFGHDLMNEGCFPNTCSHGPLPNLISKRMLDQHPIDIVGSMPIFMLTISIKFGPCLSNYFSLPWLPIFVPTPYCYGRPSTCLVAAKNPPDLPETKVGQYQSAAAHLNPMRGTLLQGPSCPWCHIYKKELWLPFAFTSQWWGIDKL